MALSITEKRYQYKTFTNANDVEYSKKPFEDDDSEDEDFLTQILAERENEDKIRKEEDKSVEEFLSKSHAIAGNELLLSRSTAQKESSSSIQPSIIINIKRKTKDSSGYSKQDIVEERSLKKSNISSDLSDNSPVISNTSCDNNSVGLGLLCQYGDDDDTDSS